MTPLISPTLAEFGRSKGLGDLAMQEGGALSLRLGGQRRLDFHLCEDEQSVLVMLSAPLPAGDTLAIKARALSLCRLGHGHSMATAAGLTREGHLLLLTQLPAREFRLHALEQACDLLTHLHQQIAS